MNILENAMPLRVLSLEDSIQDFELLELKLLGAGYKLNIARVDKEDDYTAALRTKEYDVILADFNLPQFDAFAAVQLHNEICPDVPLICVSGSIGEEKAIELLKAGAVDYVLKDRLERLPFAIRRALDDAHEKKARQTAEEMLKKSEERFRRVSSTISDISYSCVSDENGTYALDWMSGAAELMTGYTIDELVEKKCWGFLVLEEDKKAFNTDVVDLCPGTSAKCELRLKHKNGSIIWVESFAECVASQESEKSLCIYGALVDITKRKKVEEDLLSSEQKFSTAFRSASYGMMISEIPTGRIIDVNESFLKICGYDKAELIGHSAYNLNMWFDFSTRDAMIAKLRNGEKIINVELPLRTKSGSIITSLFSSELIEVKNEQIVLSSINDITDRKKIVDELRAAKEKAEEMNKVKSSFFANMSHELRTPLIGILGFSEILEEELQDNANLSAMANTVKISGQRLMRTLNFILDVSKLETDKLQVKTNKVNIVALLKSSVELFAGVIRQKGLEYSFNCSESEIVCKIDAGLFDNVINNLINNAIKFTEKGRVVIRAYKNEGNAVVEVEDTGIGISSEKQNIIWDEFRQVSEGISRSYEGTGLGLTIAKKYTEIMGGTIAVKSQLGTGTMFTVVFPLTQLQEYTGDKIGVRGKETSTEKVVQAKRAVLFVEDDDISVHVIKTFLKDLCDIENVSDGARALEAINAKTYDMILMDINLGGGMSGIEVTKKVRTLPQYKNTPIVAVTAYAMDGDKEVFLKAGCSHYLSKPFRKLELLNMIQPILEKMYV